MTQSNEERLTPTAGIQLSVLSTTTTLARSEASGPAPTSTDEHKPIGSWLCADGPYREYIEALSGSNPGLKNPDPNNTTTQDGKARPVGTARVVLLDAAATGQPSFQTTDFKSATDLRNHFSKAKHDHDRRRIYIMEGLAPDTVAAIGGHFFMEPTFFQRQERTCVWSNDFTPVSDALPQPSLLEPDRSFHLQYCELRQFNKALENRYYFCERTRRHVGMTAPRHKEETTTGILRRKVSWWSRETSKGGWDVVILCDPQLAHLSPDPKEIVEGEKNPRLIENVFQELTNEPFQEGYTDFLPTIPYDKIAAKMDHPHPHTSMCQDLIHYYAHYADMLPDTHWQTPALSAVFLKKIVAAHYLQLVDYIKVMLPSLEARLTTAWVEEQDQWKSLQTISRRCGNYRDDIEDALLSLGYSLDSPNPNSPNAGSRIYDWKDCEKDFQYAYYRLKVLKERADNLMQAMTGLASIAGNRQALEEAKRVKRLNLLALLFIPLAYTSSLFGMEGTYAPNGDDFWIYWVSAFGVVVATFIITWALDNAQDDVGQWTSGPLKYLKFWRWGREKEVAENMTRKATGLYK
ncbi:hypothetical protein T440DRAFT_470904 [Plenodomus tracheiphilus IPT5]|uniref:Cora-domain-containing protein n=1 Tax=Plenodomus tracheiphilus IPT5 TaxID=1408161 RepID=A0A6A7AWH9_9PLEO|nr:hypothetical protein T440DRAFT_470904 [Plenodomus tracheiphilus IPT5]